MEWKVEGAQKDWGEIIKTIQKYFRESNRFSYSIIIAIIIVIWGLSGLYIVGPGEQGVVRRFGRFVRISAPGLRYRLPRPFENHNVVDIATVRRTEIGYRTGHPRSIEEEALMLTGDENIVKVHLFVQYRVVDPVKFLFRAIEPEVVLHSTAEVALRSIVGQNTIDYTMTEGRVDVQEKVQEYLQNLMDLYETGIVLVDARLLTVDPPDPVKDAFHEVVRAWEDRERLVQQAEGYMEDLLPRARGEARAMILNAEGYLERRTLTAQGDVSRFLQFADEYEKAPQITRERLYLETMSEVLPQAERLYLPEEMTSGVLPFLPLTEEGWGQK